MKPLEPPDSHHVQSAQGWLELGNPLEANEELEKVAPSLRVHPDVLEVRLQIYARSKKWEACVDIAEAIVQQAPERVFGWIQRSFALHELKRTREARDALLPAAHGFPEEWIVPYNLACYTCQMGLMEEAKIWLGSAFDLGGSRRIKLMALEDPDLEPIWKNIGGA